MQVKGYKEENGAVVFQDNKPVVVYEDGTESPFDVVSTVKKIAELTNESASYRVKLKELNESLKGFEGLSPDEARKALTLVKNLEDKKLVDAGEVETLKAKILSQAKDDMESLKKAYDTKLQEQGTLLGSKDETIHRLMLGNKFATTKIMDKLTIPPDIAQDYFGKNFKVESINGVLTTVGYLGEHKINSKERPGEIATFDEAFQTILENYPMKDRIMKETGGGSGAAGGSGHGVTGNVVTLSAQQMRELPQADYERIKKEGKQIKVI